MNSVRRGAKAVLCFVLLLSAASCSSLFYYPSHNLFYPPWKYGYKVDEIPMRSGDGTLIYGWFFRAPGKPRGTLVQFHGNGENMSSHYLSLVWLVKNGYNLFTFDYRGYGKSRGTPDQKGTYLDGLKALSVGWKLNEENGAGIFVVYAQSLGGVIAMRSIDDFTHKDRTRLLVMDSTFVDYHDIARRKLESSWVTWIFSPLAYVLVSDKYSAEDALKRNKIPLLVIHDKADPAVPFGAGQEIYDEATSHKDFWVLDQGRHVGIFSGDNTAYCRRFLDYLNALVAR